MNSTQTSRLLTDIGRTYPIVMGVLKYGCKCSAVPCACQTTGKHWAAVLADLPDEADDHLDNVVYEYTKAERRLPENTSDLVFEIRSEVLRRYHKNLDTQEQHEKYLRPDVSSVRQYLGQFRMAHVAIRLGELRRDKQLDCNEEEYYKRKQIVFGLFDLEANKGETIQASDLPEWLKKLLPVT